MTATTIADTLAEFQRAGIRNLPDLRALIHLAGVKQASSTNLSLEIDVSPATATQVIDRLSVRGYVTRHCSSIDRRLVLVRITAAGRQLITPLLP
jgi:DNA-binding MarR family transcriptional regulator